METTIYSSSEASQMRVTLIDYMDGAFVLQAEDVNEPGALCYAFVTIPDETRETIHDEVIEELRAFGDIFPGLRDSLCQADPDGHISTREILLAARSVALGWAKPEPANFVVTGYRFPSHGVWSLTPSKSVIIVSHDDDVSDV